MLGMVRITLLDYNGKRWLQSSEPPLVPVFADYNLKLGAPATGQGSLNSQTESILGTVDQVILSSDSEL